MTKEQLQKRLGEIHDEMESIIQLADADKRDMTEEESQRFESLSAEFDRVEGEIKAREKLEQQEARRSASAGLIVDKIGTPKFEDGKPRHKSEPETLYATPNSFDGKAGFRNFGEFALAVWKHGTDRTIDNRLSQILGAPTTYGSEGVGADGGFAVPPDFRANIMNKVMSEDSLVTRTEIMPTGSNSITFPVDETTPWQTTGGVQAYRVGEGVAGTQSKPNLKSHTLKIEKLMVLVPMTEELLEDAPALTTWLSNKAASKLQFRMNKEIISGTGVGQALGIINSPDLVSVAKESSQSAATVVSYNIIKMWSRCYSEWRRNAVWLINQDIEPELLTMSVLGKLRTGADDTGWGSGVGVVYMPPGGLSASPYGTLMGRPVIPTQACSTLGSKGDIILADLSQYLTVQKTGGIRADSNISLYFDAAAVAFRFIWRISGMSMWSQTTSALNGSNTYSAFVTLDERA